MFLFDLTLFTYTRYALHRMAQINCIRVKWCDNVGASAVSTSIPIVHFMMFYTSQFWGHPDNAVWTLYQCCILTNIPKLPKQCHNIGWRLPTLKQLIKQCVNVVANPNLATMLLQCSGNVWMLYQRCPMLYPANAQCCGNVVTTLSLVMSDTIMLQHCHNVGDKRYMTILL